MTTFTATYSPEDNKLRLYASGRLDSAMYNRVKAHGFKLAPRQELFVAPMWTPAREDLLLELCGEIGDDDTSLVERAEERADRFCDYSNKRASDAASARNSVAAIADGIPFGQPILVGHHSERRARKDAERIENGMRRAVQMWETSEYWKQRAAGALRHAKYKELPAVRHRRIKGLEADKRKQERYKQEAEMWLKLWLECEAEQDAELQQAVALRIAGMCWLRLPRKEGDREDFNGYPTAYDALTNAHPTLYAPRTLAEVVEVAKKSYPATIAHCDRWLAHYENRIAYEQAMLGEQGGIAADRFDIQPGGQVLVRGEWLTVTRVNKTGGQVSSVSTNSRYVRVKSIEEVKDYRAPTEEQAAAVKKATKLPPLVNYPGDGFLEMTAEDYRKKPNDYKGTRVEKATAEHGAYRYRTAFAPGGSYRIVQVYITDAKRVDLPAPASGEAATLPAPTRDIPFTVSKHPAPAASAPESGEEFKAMREQLRAGVQVVSAPQLFPTPAPLAARMVELAVIDEGESVLEPSAGTGVILRAIREKTNGRAVRTAIEINGGLCDRLRIAEAGAEIINCDFLQFEPPAKYDAIVMNPPFANADDVKHIQHAVGMLRPGGRLVAICANGPRQNEKLRPLVEQYGGEWEDLPAGTFAESGTMVNTALIFLTV